MHVSDTCERRVVLQMPSGIWMIHSRFKGPVVAEAGFRITRETHRAIFFTEVNSGPAPGHQQSQ